MFSFNQPNCITALPRPEEARRRIQNDKEECRKRDGQSEHDGGDGGLVAAVRGNPNVRWKFWTCVLKRLYYRLPHL